MLKIHFPGFLEKISALDFVGAVSSRDRFNPQISQITQIIIDVRKRLRNLPGLIPRSLLR